MGVRFESLYGFLLFTVNPNSKNFFGNTGGHAKGMIAMGKPTAAKSLYRQSLMPIFMSTTAIVV
jgi:hypothetical protein